MRKKFFIIILFLIVIGVTMLALILTLKKPKTFQIEGNVLPLIDNAKYIRKETGKDVDGNPYMTFFYNPKEINDTDIEMLLTTLSKEYNFVKYEEEALEEGIQMVSNENKAGKKIVATLYWDDFEVYVKYTICNDTILDTKKEINSTSANNHESHYMTNIDGKQYSFGEEISIGYDKFTVVYNEDVKYISKNSIKDENGNDCVIVEYQPEDFNQDIVWDYINMLVDFDGYFELEADDSSTEYSLIAHANNPESVRTIYICRKENRAYIKCSICKVSTVDLSKLGDYYENFMEE